MTRQTPRDDLNDDAATRSLDAAGADPAAHAARERLAGALRRKVGRRGFVTGAGAVGAGAVAAGLRLLTSTGGATSAPTPRPTATGAASASPTPPAIGGVVGQATPPVPAGMALVTSSRLPLFGVGADDPDRLLAGKVSDWQEVGTAISMPVEPLALANQVPAGTHPVATFPDYEALVAGLAKHPGGVALIPLSAVDFRVNVLSVAGHDPLRDQDGPSSQVFSVGVVGDIVPGRNVNDKMVAYGDYTHPFLKIAHILSSFDLMFANLEGDLSNTLQPPSDPHTFTFVSSPKMLDGFKLAGIDAVSLANNHSTWNEAGWGTQGLLDTIGALENAGIPYFGAGRNLDKARAPWSPRAKGATLAIIGIDGVTANEDDTRPGTLAGSVAAGADSAGTNPFLTQQFLADITAATQQADIVIPYFHFGVEYIAVLPQWAVDGARAAIDAGATMVVTNHPHVIQGMEIYKGKPIVYSVGNFIFDQMFSVNVREGMILELTFDGKRLVGLRGHGVEIEDFNQPRLMTAGELASLMDRFWDATDRLIEEKLT